MEREGNSPKTAALWQVPKQSHAGAIHSELMFLADASEQLTGSLDPRTILERLTVLSVPYLADWCTVDLLERGAADTMGLSSGGGSRESQPGAAIQGAALDPTLPAVQHAQHNQGTLTLHRGAPDELRAALDRLDELTSATKNRFCRVVAKHVNPELEGLLRAVSPDAEERLGIAKVLRSGESELLPDLDADEKSGGDATRMAAIERLGTRSAMAVPLIARGRKLGVLSFGVSVSDRIYSADDLVLAAELAHRVALALDNAYLYRKAEEARQAAERSADRAAWLFAVTAALSDAITPPAVLRVLASDVVAAAGAMTAMVVLRAGLGGELELVRSTGYLDAQIAGFKQFDVEAELPLARAVRERQPIFLQSDEQIRRFEPGFVACCSVTGEHAYAAIPLFLEGRVLGAVGFGFASPQSFSEDDRAFMLALVQQSAQALDRARLAALQTEEATHLSHEVLRQMPEAILVTDVEGNIRYWLGEAESIFGYLAEEIVGKNMALLHREDMRGEVSLRILQQIEASRTFVGEIPCVRRDGSEVPIEITAYAVHDQEGRPILLVGIHRDITDRKRAEEERARLIRAQAARAEAEEAARRFAFLAELSTALAASLDFTATLQALARLVIPVLADFCVVDVDDGLGVRHVAVAHVNPPREPLLRHFQPTRLDGEPGPVGRVLRTGRSELYPDIRGEALLHDAMSTEEATAYRELAPLSYLVVALRARGRILGALSLATSESGSGRCFERPEVAFAEEVAHRAALALDNARLYREVQDANRLKDEFLGTVSHELRTPLNAILGWARMMQAGSLDRVAESRALSAIERNAEHQVTLIDELLDASQVVTGTLKIERLAVELTLPVQTAIESILPSAAGKGVAVETRLDPEGVFVEGDPARLQQVVWQLLSNAVKFARPGGVVTVHLSQDERCAEVKVVDDGEGISADLLPHVFERFRQGETTAARRHGGLGLGLSIVRHIVELHGGTVRISSAGPGRGTTCIVQLPLSTGAAATALTNAGLPPDPRNPFPRLTGVRVLIADDDPDTLAMLSSVLRRCGAEVSTATSANEAFRLLEASEPSLLVADIGMPGEDGYSLIRRVRDLLPRKVGRTPALALTLYARTEDRVRALAAGYQMHVPKPIEPIELAAAVKSLAAGFTSWHDD